MKKNWVSAEQYCLDQSGLLVVINSKEEQNALRLEVEKQARGEHKPMKLNTTLLMVAFSALSF